MTTTIERELGALTEGMRGIQRELAEAREGRRRTYEKLEGMDFQLGDLGRRVETVERALTTLSPTVNEFVTLKTQAQGAGKLGAFLWKLGGLVLAAAAGAAGMWSAFTSNFPWK